MFAMDGYRGRGQGNPWNRGNLQANHTKRKPNTERKVVKKPAAAISTAENKFLEAQARLQASVQKHINNEYESSSEEEELESDNILGSVLKSYSQLGGKSEDLGRTQQFLEDAFQSGAATCLICIASVKRADAIWNCEECFCFFHLTCIQRWARDSIFHQKQVLEELPHQSKTSLLWSCPKCRHDYEQDSIPQRYFCFCGQMEDPTFHPWLVPHSCGDTCNRPLQPLCGHSCLLLCHPGPCPPCPKTVKNTCYCKKQPPQLQRCNNKMWSCKSACGQLLQCGRHECAKVCHADDCPPCPKTSSMRCQCGLQEMQQPCADPIWNCSKVCGKPLSCGHHICETVCHAGVCGNCPLAEDRSCPCGKTSFKLPCTQDVPTCGDTCGRLLECGAHSCSRPCHRDKCGTCLEVVTKTCRCGLHKKEQPCKKEYLCDTKCKRVKNCSRHPCNRKCCDGNCPPCEKPCGRTLTCGNHKCASVCHRGQCYPCPTTAEVKCHCGHTVLVVPCGRKKKTKPPRCTKLCRIEPKCHHPRQEPHRCHFGDCPPCRQVCKLEYKKCGHNCIALCHSAVWVKVCSEQKPAGPWEKVTPQFQLQALPCPDCKVPVPITCLGDHETCDWPCYIANPTSCQRECGRKLTCDNHTCSFLCHKVEEARNEIDAGSNCEVCESGCTKARPDGCVHPCLKACHPEGCPPCTQMIRMQCHCHLSQLYIQCNEWTSANGEKQKTLQSCGNQCPKNFGCGHRCRSICHSGDCPDGESCRKKVKINCPCRRLRKELTCDVVRAGQARVDCDETCKKKKEENRKAHDLECQQKKLEEERRNQEEMERFQKKFQGRKKQRDRRQQEFTEEQSFFSRYWLVGCGVLAVLVATFLMISKPLNETST